jgi:hypothetical protein
VQQQPAGTEALLLAGEAPAVLGIPAGRGWVVLEIAELAADRDWQARGATPLWAQRVARQLTARAAALTVWTAGAPVPVTATLARAGSTVQVRAGEPLAVAPGSWTQAADAGTESTVVVLPDADEGRIDQDIASIPSALTEALPRSGGRDLGPWLLAAALLLALGEGLIAAWAGRAYGR